jgi:fructose-bisphosphate aldolase class 1
VSDVALKTNAKELASYAEICLRKSIVPIVEPEILIDVRLRLKPGKQSVPQAAPRRLDALIHPRTDAFTHALAHSSG